MQILVGGNEISLDYKLQTFTPAYDATSADVNYFIKDISPRSFRHGQNLSVTYGVQPAVQLPAVNRVVMIKLGGHTHGNHMDQRLVELR